MTDLFGGDSFFLVLIGIFFFFISFFSMKSGLILMALSMLFSPEFKMGSIGMRDVTLRLEDVLIPILVLSWIAQRAMHRDGALLVSTPLNKPILFLLGLSIVSSLRGIASEYVSPLPSFFYMLKTAQYFAIFFLFASDAKSEKQIKFYLWFAILTAAMIGFYTLLQVPSVRIFSGQRITAPFEGDAEPATMGGYMAFLLLIIFSLFIYQTKIAPRLVLGLLGIIIFIPFLFTLNRTSHAALFLGLVFIGIVEKQKRYYVFILLGIFILAQAFIPALRERLLYTITDAVNPGRELGVDFSFQERIYAFRKMFQTWKYSPLIGWGITSIEIVDSQYARTLHEIGIIGLGLWLWIFSRLLKIGHWLFDVLEDQTLKGMVLGYSAGILGLLLHGFGAITFYIVRIMEPFWFVSGLVMALYLIHTARHHARPFHPVPE